MGNSNSALSKCLTAAVGGDSALLAFPSDPLFQIDAVKAYNLDDPVTPSAVTWPQTTEQVAAIVKCAVDNNLKVAPKCGGHSYGNYGLGGKDGAVVVDLKNFQQFNMDNATWHATIGGGTLLGDVTTRLHDAGGRAIAHGTCPQVGIGGHATIGGLGPPSRMWGTCLDHVEEMEVVLADSSVKTASPTENPDLFFAMKGAGGSFGIITSFKVRTQPEPGQVVSYSFSLQFGNYVDMANTLKAWRDFIAKPKLSRKFASMATVMTLGLLVQGTYFGSEDEFNELHFGDIFPSGGSSHVAVLDSWMGAVGEWANDAFLKLSGGIPTHFYSKSLTFTPQTLMSDQAIDDVFKFMDSTDKGTIAWAVIFDLAGGAVNDVAQDATAYAHRDALFYMQSYAVSILEPVSDTIRNFLEGINSAVEKAMPDAKFTTYAGYVDPLLPNAQESYWGSNLPKLEQIKKQIDPNEVFWNPQSVRPAGAPAAPSNANVRRKLPMTKRSKKFIQRLIT